MAKDTALHLRTTTELKEALQACAEDESRSVAVMTELLLRQALVERGYLEASGKRGPRFGANLQHLDKLKTTRKGGGARE
jgi:hypothetical protein